MLLSVVSRPRGIALIAISSSIDDLRHLVECCNYAQYGATCEKDQIVEICCDERIKENLLLCAIGLRLRPQSKRMSVEEAISIVTSSETAKCEATVILWVFVPTGDVAVCKCSDWRIMSSVFN